MKSESTNPFLDLAHWPEWHSGQFRSITTLAPDKLTIEHGDTQEVALQGMTFSPTGLGESRFLPAYPSIPRLDSPLLLRRTRCVRSYGGELYVHWFRFEPSETNSGCSTFRPLDNFSGPMTLMTTLPGMGWGWMGMGKNAARRPARSTRTCRREWKARHGRSLLEQNRLLPFMRTVHYVAKPPSLVRHSIPHIAALAPVDRGLTIFLPERHMSVRRQCAAIGGDWRQLAAPDLACHEPENDSSGGLCVAVREGRAEDQKHQSTGRGGLAVVVVARQCLFMVWLKACLSTTSCTRTPPLSPTL